MSSLKPCPFCNADVTMTTQERDANIVGDVSTRIKYQIHCLLCGVAMTRYNGYNNNTLETINELVERWNNRP